MKDTATFFGFVVGTFLLIAVLWIAGGFIGLWWYPYSIQRQTAIVRGSNSYISAHQQELISLNMGLTQAQEEAQKRAIIMQMCQQASLIPEYVPVSITQVLAGRCN